MIPLFSALEQGKKLKSIHDGHHEIQEDDAGDFFLEICYGRFSVVGGPHLPPGFLNWAADHGAGVRIVIDDKDVAALELFREPLDDVQYFFLIDGLRGEPFATS
jgi:hypothetical protein